jgi:hypothetical protein
MAIHRHHLPDLSCRLPLLDDRPDRAVTWIPRGLVVHEHLDTATIGRPFDPLRVSIAHCKRLLHHYVDVPGGRGFDDSRVIVGVRERCDRFGFSAVEHRGEINEARGFRDLVAIAVLREKRPVGIVDADNLNISAPLRATQKAADVAVDETGNGQAQRLFGLRLVGRQRQDGCDEKDRE